MPNLILLSLTPFVLLSIAAALDVRRDSEADARLQRRLPEVHLHGVALSDAIEFLRDVSGANVFVDWTALKLANVDKDHPITLDAQNVTAAQALEQVLRSAGAELDYRGHNGVIVISTNKQLEHPRRIMRLPRGRDLAANAAAAVVLERKLPQVKFEAVPLPDALKFFEEKTDVPVDAEWPMLEKAGVHRDARVTLLLRNVSASDGLTYVIRAACGDAPIQFALRDGTVTVSTQEQFDGDRITRAFEVADLLPEVAREAAADRLLHKIEEATAPVAAADRHPPTALLQGDRLVVTQTPENIKAIAELLEKLRDERDRR